MSQADLQKAEKQALATLDPADVAARQAELRQQRDLMYRAERKAKRVAKIKSKAYRRIHRKLKGKQGANGLDGLSLEDLAEMDKLDGGDRVAEQTARMEVERARERATLKHSSKGGRWSRTDIGGLEGLDAERNSAVRDMAARNEQLRRRIAGLGDDDASGDEFDSGSSGDENEDDADRDVDDIRRDAMDELKSLEAKERALAANAPKLKGVVGMKFMQDAIKRGERQAQLQAEELQGKLERIGQQAERGLDGGSDAEDEPLAMSEQVQGNLGRLVFGPSSTKPAGVSQAEQPVATSAKANSLTAKLSGPLTVESARASTSRSPLVAAATAESSISNNEESNPWLAVGEDGSAGRVSRKSNKATFGKDARDATRVADKAARTKSKQTDAREAERDDAQVDIDPTSALVAASAKRRNVPQIGNTPSVVNGKAVARPAQPDGSDEDSGDEDDDEAIDAQRGKGHAAFKQRELVAKAFAGDNVVAVSVSMDRAPRLLHLTSFCIHRTSRRRSEERSNGMRHESRTTLYRVGCVPALHKLAPIPLC
jgi:U3 small nucleolar RNA-associated protein 14